MRQRHAQGGWVGMIVLLLALVIVAYLSKDALMKYGLLSGAETTATTGTPGERTRSQAAGVVEKVDPTSVPATPANALERARGLESTLKQETEKRGGDY
jgi:hypothetical protein